MDALFIGQTYIDVTLLADTIPTGDDKVVAKDYSVSFGGNAVTAAFACAKLGIPTDLLTTISDDWLGQMFMMMAQRYNVSVYPRKVARCSLSFVLPKAGKRAILRARDNHYLRPFMKLDVSCYSALHLDGHQHDAALYYAKAAREAGVMVSLDGGGVRANTEEVLHHTDVAVVAEAFCKEIKLTAKETLKYLHERGVKVAAVTEGERGMIWSEEDGHVQHLAALHVPDAKVIDTSGAGDVFHGAYLASYLRSPSSPWAVHFDYARAASAHKVQHLGNEAGLPSEEDIVIARREFGGAR
jgi:sugar/nucleoside kinase (ribokinase family)